jgi:hypothetical protein
MTFLHNMLDSGKNKDATVAPKCGNSDDVFAEVARIVANKLPRRDIVKLTLIAFTGAALANLGIKTAWGQSTCLCNGQSYDPTTQCCTNSGVEAKHPIADISACPNKVAHPGHVPTHDGCGSQTSPTYPFIPNSFGSASFLSSCNNHDDCYDTCNSVKSGCDSTFLSSLDAACQSAYGSGISKLLLPTCLAVAQTYYSAVSNFGTTAYNAAQANACDCCDTSTCPDNCAGSSCGSLPACGPGGDCVCFTDTEGNGACVHGSTPCAGILTCNTTADCPSGSACLTTSCCGSSGVCGPLCNPIVSANSIQVPKTSVTGPTLANPN